jgi:hypothetical protein
MERDATASNENGYIDLRAAPWIAGAVIVSAIILPQTDFFKRATDPYFDVKTAVAAQLYDGDSAEFRNMRDASSGYCGELNAKDEMGESVGFKLFHASQSPEGGWSVLFDDATTDIYCK